MPHTKYVIVYIALLLKKNLERKFESSFSLIFFVTLIYDFFGSSFADVCYHKYIVNLFWSFQAVLGCMENPLFVTSFLKSI